MTLHPFFRLAVAAGLVIGSTGAFAATTTVPGGRYGDVTVTQPAGPLRGFVVLYSQGSGWSAADQQSLDALMSDLKALHQAMVAIIQKASAAAKP